MEKLTVHADVKFHSQMPFTSVDVCFRSEAEVLELIRALQRLLDKNGLGLQLTLADPASYDPAAPLPTVDSLPTSVTFNPLGYERDEIDLRCLAAARSHLESLVPEED